jgi:hypothetical protein
MRETKPFASLSSGLLARKGGAKPAMRPQGFNSYGGSLEDLGWDDMGQGDDEMPEHVPSPVTALTPAPASPPRVHAVAPAPRPVPEPVIESIPEPIAPEPVAPEAIMPEPIVPKPVVVEQQRNLRESFDNAPPAVEHEHEHEHEREAEESFAEEAEAAPQPQGPESFAEEAEAAPRTHEPEGFAEQAEIVALPRRRSLPTEAKPKAAFTLRLDPDRHLRLRLASAITRRSAQILVTAALDDFLNSLPELEALAERVPAEAGQRGR